jgi:hypothetical protein
MARLKKITVQVPAELLERARKDGEGITETVRQSLELRANQETWAALRKWRGKVKWSIDYKTMKYDR